MVSPTENYILVKLEDDYGHIAITEQKYSTKTKGICVRVGDTKYSDWVGKRVYWESYKDDTKVDDNHCFIKVEYVMGTEDVDA